MKLDRTVMAIVAAFVAPAALAYVLVWIWIVPLGNELLPMYTPQNVPGLVAVAVLDWQFRILGLTIFGFGIFGEVQDWLRDR